ncbi:hypothetical protein QFC21_004185 [Naganishia friedmannii]|uniref:Uncharacterized protein n=1 Tax=Naganishia friedmannii TaxID=89922 RepID=A0ACC2VJG9_9TREE|nr:hypothetical protein QFC21_004185 [Naganishia friedmannii]
MSGRKYVRDATSHDPYTVAARHDMSSKKYTTSASIANNATPTLLTKERTPITNQRIQVLSFIIQLGLIAYGEYHDRHSVLKYTDIDYRVFSDAVHALWTPDPQSGNLARGPLTRWMGWTVGDPYTRATYRYTPLLAVLLSPIHILPSPLGPIFGKVLFSFISSFTIPSLLLRLSNAERQRNPATERSSAPPDWLIHGIWTLNPMILNINTRGSSEALLVVLVLGALVALKEQRLRTCAILWGASIHWKLYPVIYASSLFMVLQRMDGGRMWTRRKVVFGTWSVGTVAGLSSVCWLIWGYPFLEHAFLYHATRMDHRHNFSAYFYPIYLQMFTEGSINGAGGGVVSTLSSAMDRVARHPLSSFFPQFSLAIGSGFLLPASSASITFTWFIQTLVFVTFNKVCTSQYFIWYLFFLPIVIPQLDLGRTKGAALWLSTAYRLEFLAQNVFLTLWTASLAFLAANTWCIGVLLDSYRVEGRVKTE